MSKLSKTLKIALALFIAVFSSGLIQLYQAPAALAKSNNGTLKVHEKGTSTADNSENPHVCVFYFEAFGLDAKQTGNITIEAQSPTDPITPVVIPLTTDVNGNGTTPTPNVNDTGSQYVLAQGHYKATLDNKFGTDQNGKAKSKVFWVSCDAIASPQVTVTPVCGPNNDTIMWSGTHMTVSDTGWAGGKRTLTWTADAPYTFTGGASTYAKTYTDNNIACPPQKIDVPAAPSVTDPCGLGNATWNIPANTTQITWSLNLKGELIASTNSGYVFTDNTTSHNYGKAIDSGALCPVTPVAPIVVDKCGTENDTVTLADTAGITYSIKRVGNVLTVTATPKADYKLTSANGWTLHQDGTATWTMMLNDEPCKRPVTPSVPTKIDICGTKDDGYIIPQKQGVTYQVNGHTVKPGFHHATGSVTITAIADNGYYFSEGTTTSWTFNFTNQPCSVVTVSHSEMCVTSDNGTITVEVHNNHTKATTYKVVVDGTIKFVTVPAGNSQAVTFTGLSAGDHEVNVFERTGKDKDHDDKDKKVVSDELPLTVFDGKKDDDKDFKWKLIYDEDVTLSQCSVTITKAFVSYSDVNGDGLIGVGDKANWLITVTNTSDAPVSFNVTVSDPGATLQNGGVITNLQPGQPKTLTATTVITLDNIGATVCKVTNVANFNAYPLQPEIDVLRVDEVEQPGIATPLLTGSANASQTFTCPTGGKGGGTIPTPTPVVPLTPPTLQAPNTGAERQQSGISLEGAALILASIVGTLAFGAVYFSRRQAKLEQ